MGEQLEYAKELFDPNDIYEELEHMGAGDPTDQPVQIDLTEEADQDAGA